MSIMSDVRKIVSLQNKQEKIGKEIMALRRPYELQGQGAVNVLDKEIEAETAKQAYKAVSHD